MTWYRTKQKQSVAVDVSLRVYRAGGRVALRMYRREGVEYFTYPFLWHPSTLQVLEVHVYR